MTVLVDHYEEGDKQVKLHVTLDSPHPVHASFGWLLESNDVANKEHFIYPS